MRDGAGIGRVDQHDRRVALRLAAAAGLDIRIIGLSQRLREHGARDAVASHLLVQRLDRLVPIQCHMGMAVDDVHAAALNARPSASEGGGQGFDLTPRRVGRDLDRRAADVAERNLGVHACLLYTSRCV